MTQISFIAYGTPAPQGSKNKGRNGGLYESSKALHPWRQVVLAAAIETMGGAGNGIEGPVNAFLVFTMPKPKSAPKTRKTWPGKKPDVDKLSRAVLDALTDAGAIEDDSRVVWLSAAKVFPGEAQDALPVPGVSIKIKKVEA